MYETDTPQVEANADTPAPPRKPGLVLAVLAGAQLMVVLDITIITIAVPSIQQDLNFSPTSLQWVINGTAPPPAATDTARLLIPPDRTLTEPDHEPCPSNQPHRRTDYGADPCPNKTSPF